MLTEPAFNALLKTLEEPPAHAVFILATTEPQKVPVTIRSRCQHIPFRRIPGREIARRLAAARPDLKLVINSFLLPDCHHRDFVQEDFLEAVEGFREAALAAEAEALGSKDLNLNHLK